MTTRLKLFGSPRAWHGNRQLEISWQIPAALLCYLACQGDWVGRDEAAALLRPDDPETIAKARLRNTIFRAKSLAWAERLEVEPTRLRFRVESDVTRFREALTAEAWEQALDLYEAPFLEGVGPLGNPGFDDWLEAERTALHGRWREAAFAIVKNHYARGKAGEAVRLLETLFDDDPLDEEAVQLLLQTARGQAQRRQALRLFDRFRTALREEMALDPLGTTQQLADALRHDNVGVLTEVNPPPRQPLRLPREPTPFVGRPDMLEAIAAKLDQSACRLLTLLGPGGIGKTRLAQRVAQQRESRYQDGVMFLDLTNVETQGELITALLNGFDLEPAIGDHEAHLFDHLHGKRMLLILDNVEQLVPEAPWFHELLMAAPSLQLLLTSRQTLELQSEWLVSVDGLAYPQNATTPTADEARAFDAVTLFVQTAERRGYTLQQEDVASIITVCQLVEGNPLAIELAASWINLLSPQEIATEVANNLDFLARSEADRAAGHGSMRSVFEASWRRLSATHQGTLAGLSVFRGGFDRSAAEAVVGATLRDLLTLVSRSLLRRHDTGRFDLHLLIRHFAENKLEASEERERMHHRHSGHYLTKLAAYQEPLRQMRYETVAEVQRDSENIITAWRWAVGEADFELLARAVAPLHYFFSLVQRYHLGLQAFEKAVQGLEAKHARPDFLARLKAREGMFRAHLGDFERGQALLEESLRATSEPAERAFIYQKLGDLVFTFTGDFHSLQVVIDKALRLYRELDDLYGLMQTLYALAVYHWHVGAFEEGVDHAEKSLELAQQLGHRSWTATAMMGLGALSIERKDYARARNLLQTSLERFHDLGRTSNIALAHNNLGQIDLAVSNHAEAEAHFRASLALNREVSDNVGVAEDLYFLGRVQLARGDEEQAKVLFKESLAVSLRISAEPSILRALLGLADWLAGHDAERSLDLYVLISEHRASIFGDKEHARAKLEDLKPAPERLKRVERQLRQATPKDVASTLLHHPRLHS